MGEAGKRTDNLKQFINNFLSIISPLAAVPTGWAIYAGVTEQPAFPMWEPAAVIGAFAVISTSIAAGLLVTDIKAYNQGLKNKTERDELGMSALYAWLVFGGCVLAEITLSLLVVVFPAALAFGVLVFPLMTAAGVFAFAIRFDLQKRESGLNEIRLLAKKQKELAKSQPKPAKAEQKPATEPVEPAKPAFVCGIVGCNAKPFGSQSALNAHKRKHKPIAYSVSLIQPVEKQ